MIKKIKKSIINKRGNGYILGCVIVLAFIMIFAVVAEHGRTYMTILSARDGLESIATTVATNNCDEIYPSQREGYFSAHTLNSRDQWQEDIKKDNLDKYVKEVLGVKKENNVYLKKDKHGNIDFKLSNIKLNINNPNLTPSDSEKNKKTFTVEITGDLEVHKMFTLFSDNKNVNLKIGAKVGYLPKF